MTQIGEDIADYFIPLDDEVEEHTNEAETFEDCIKEYMAKKLLCESLPFLSPAEVAECIREAKDGILPCLERLGLA